MKRKLYTALWICAAAGMITACGSSFKAAESTVYITDEGTVTGADIEDFSEDYYDEEELENYITESVDRYVAANGDGSVELDSFKIVSSENGQTTAQLYLNYATYIDYAQFKDVTLFAGTISQAQAENHAFDQGFVKVEDGSPAGSAAAKDFLDSEELKVVVIGEKTLVRVDGTIAYVSDGNVELTGKNTARVTYDLEDPDAQPAYIICS